MIQKTKIITLDNELSKKRSHIDFLNPEKCYFHLTNMRCKESEVFIKEGDYVKVGQVIGKRKAAFFEQNIQSTISGTFVGMEKHLHRTGDLTEFMVIENDFKDAVIETATDLSYEEIAKLGKEKVLELVKYNSNIGLGGSGFPTYIKLETPNKIKTVLVNGAECEPYLTSDVDTMFAEADKIIYGLHFMIEFYGADKGIIGIKNKHKELIKFLNERIEALGLPNISLQAVGNYYPAGWEKDLITSITGIEVPAGKMPAEYGVMVFNSTSLLAIHNGIKYNLPILEREVSLVGEGFNTPMNLKVKIGTHVPEIVEKAGGYREGAESNVYIVGGPMMGTSVKSDDVVVSKAFSTIIATKPVEAKEEPCINCGTCVYSCPAGLQPVNIMNAMKARDSEKIEKLNIRSCIECGMCSYVCTSKIDLTKHMRRSKRMI